MTIQRKIKCSNINCPHEKRLQFNDWMRSNLIDSSDGYFVTDIDFILFIITNRKTNKFVLLEVKTNNKPVSTWQKNCFNSINECLIIGSKYKKIKYLGYHYILFEKYFFNDGKCFLDNEEKSENEIKNILNKFNFKE